MTDDQVIWEYRQIMAWKYEEKTGKPYSEDVLIDATYEEWQRQLGIDMQKLKQGHGRQNP